MDLKSLFSGKQTSTFITFQSKQYQTVYNPKKKHASGTQGFLLRFFVLIQTNPCWIQQRAFLGLAVQQEKKPGPWDVQTAVGSKLQSTQPIDSVTVWNDFLDGFYMFLQLGIDDLTDSARCRQWWSTFSGTKVRRTILSWCLHDKATRWSRLSFKLLQAIIRWENADFVNLRDIWNSKIDGEAKFENFHQTWKQNCSRYYYFITT